MLTRLTIFCREGGSNVLTGQTWKLFEDLVERVSISSEPGDRGCWNSGSRDDRSTPHDEPVRCNAPKLLTGSYLEALNQCLYIGHNLAKIHDRRFNSLAQWLAGDNRIPMSEEDTIAYAEELAVGPFFLRSF